MMKAIIQRRYGDEKSLFIHTVPTPQISKNNQILVKVKVANISSGDKNINTIPFGFPLNVLLRFIYGWKGPRNPIRGITGSGVVQEVGSAVSLFKPGDHVNFIQSMKASVMAEYLLLDTKSVVAKVDASVSYEQSAPIAFGALTADYFINSNNIKLKDRVLIYGASGAVGTYAAFLAKHYGGHVTGVFRQHHSEMLKTIPFDEIIDYSTTKLSSLNGRYDVVFDAVGKLANQTLKALLKRNGRYYSVKYPTKENSDRLAFLNELLSQGVIKTILNKIYPFAEFQSAHQHVYQGHKTGNIVLKIDND